MKEKTNLRCKVTSIRKVFIPTHTKPNPLKFISSVFRIFYNSQNLKEITLKVYHFYQSTFALFVLQSLYTHHHHSKIKRFLLLVLSYFILLSYLSRSIQFYCFSTEMSHDICPLFHALSCACIVGCTVTYVVHRAHTICHR